MFRVNRIPWVWLPGLALAMNAALGLAPPVRRFSPWLELTIYLAWLGVFLAYPQVRANLAGCPRGYRWFAVCLIVAMMIGQVSKVQEWTYPFVNWTMYSNQTGASSVFHSAVAVTETGREAPLPLDRLPFGRRRFEARITSLGLRSQAGVGPQAERARRELADLVRSVVELHRVPGQPRIHKVLILRNRIPVEEYRGRDSIERTVVAEVEL